MPSDQRPSSVPQLSMLSVSSTGVGNASAPLHFFTFFRELLSSLVGAYDFMLGGVMVVGRARRAGGSRGVVVRYEGSCWVVEGCRWLQRTRGFVRSKIQPESTC